MVNVMQMGGKVNAGCPNMIAPSDAERKFNLLSNARILVQRQACIT